MKAILLFLLFSISIGLTAQTATLPAGSGTYSDPYQIANLENLYWITAPGTVNGLTQEDRWDKCFIQTADIDASITATWDVGDHDNDQDTPDVAQGWLPIGYFNSYFPELNCFKGVYNGQGYTISSLYINRPELEHVGLFGYVKSNYYPNTIAMFQNINLVNVNYHGGSDTGGIIGYVESNSSMRECSVNGSIIGGNSTGGLVGHAVIFDFENCQSNATIKGADNYCGGLIGYAVGSTIENCFSNSVITGTGNYYGGLVGLSSAQILNSNFNGSVSGEGSTHGGIAGMAYGVITNSYSTANINGYDSIGGLVGHASNLSVIKCYSTGNVTGNIGLGGLVGNLFSGTISNSFSTGYVNGVSSVGGFSGIVFQSSITNSYSNGVVSGTNNSGGFVGYTNEATITGSFWDIESSGKTTSNGGIGKTTAEMKTLSTYTDAGWDFTEIWLMQDGFNNGYPYLNYVNSVDNDVAEIQPESAIAFLKNAYPNPFNPSTTISFDVVTPCNVSINIYNIKGQLVKKLVDEAYNKGTHSIVWNGKDNNNNLCTSGVYFYKMQAGHYSQSKKMMMIK